MSGGKSHPMKPDDSDAGRQVQAGVGTFFQDHPGAFITIVAVFLNGVGLVYGFFSLAFFDINYFDFAEADDFLISAFRNPGMFLYICAVAFFGAQLLRFSSRRWFPAAAIAYVLVLAFGVPAWLGSLAADPTTEFQPFANKYTRVFHDGECAEGECAEKERVGKRCLLEDHRLVTKVGDFVVFANGQGDAIIIRRSDVVQIYEGN